jgi:hypothetical protein
MGKMIEPDQSTARVLPFDLAILINLEREEMKNTPEKNKHVKQLPSSTNIKKTRAINTQKQKEKILL